MIFLWLPRIWILLQDSLTVRNVTTECWLWNCVVLSLMSLPKVFIFTFKSQTNKVGLSIFVSYVSALSIVSMPGKLSENITFTTLERITPLFLTGTSGPCFTIRTIHKRWNISLWKRIFMESDCYTDCCSYFMLYIFTSFLSDKKRVSLYISGTQIQVNTLSQDRQA